MPKYPHFNPMSIVTQGEASRASGGGPFVYPQLTATNYTSWVIRVQAIMEDQEVWEVVEPATGTAVDTKKCRKARAHLLQVLPEDLLMQVANKKTAKEVWECLKKRFVSADRVKAARLQTLKSDFDALRMKEDESLDQYAGKLTGMAVRYANLGGTLNDAALVKKLFDTVPDRFINVIAGIEQFFDLNTLAFEEAVGRLKAFEERTRRAPGGATADGQLLLTRAEWEAQQKKEAGESSARGKTPTSGGRGRGGRGRGRGRGRGGRGNTPGKESAGVASGGTRDKSHIECFNCGKYGHYANQCKQPKEGEAHHARVEDVEPALMLAVSEELAPLERAHATRQEVVFLTEEKVFPELHIAGARLVTGGNWYLDNGASNHMTGDREKFQELDEAVTGKVRFGDGSTVQIEGKGSVLFECKNGDQWQLHDVYFIPKLCSNLVSLGQLTEIGYRVVLDGDELEVFDKMSMRLIMKVQRSPNRLYHIELKEASPVCLLASMEDPAWLWHARLGHVNFQALKKLVDKGMAAGVPSITHPNQLCHACLAAKQARGPFPVMAQYRAEEPLELLHIDLCGPISPSTAAGNKYFMLLVDDLTRWMWVHVLKTKDQACSEFVKFKAVAENFCGRRIKTLRSDRGGEFLAAAFAKVCEEAGIHRHLTAPYTPQQNGVVERRNRTVMEMARSLLKTMNVPGRFWGEAVRHAVYLLNRLPSKSMGERTPFEAWNKKKPHLAHLRVFGCTAHVKMTAAHLKKLDDRSQQMVYLGVEDGCKAHRLFDPRRGKIFVSRDVIFEEKVQWNWCAGEVGNEPAEFTVEDDDWVNPSSWAMASGPAGAPGMAPAMSTSPSVVTAAHMEQEEQISTPPATPASQPFLEQNALESPRSGNSEEGPIRYRNLEDIYQNTSEVELAYGSDGEALLAEMEEPSCYSEAAGYPEWEKAMNREIESIEKNGTWTLTTLPARHKPIGLKWVYKLKKNSGGEVFKHKARLVAKGYVQRQGIDFEEVFAPVARLDTVRMILAVAANRGWEVHHLDVKSAFLNGELEEEVYVSQPEGYTVKNKEHLVLRLSKALYGLRQAPRAWNIRLDKSLKNLGFRRCVQEQAVYTRGEGRAAVVIGVYVDDLIVTGDDPMQIQAFKQQMTKQFEMSDLGLLSYYLGIEVSQQERCLTLKQTGYAVKVLTQFGMMDCNPTKYPMEQRAQLHKDPDGQLVDATEYRRVIGCLRYLLHTRPDLSFAVGVASRFMEKPTVMHYKAVKQILRYLKGTIHFGLVYSR